MEKLWSNALSYARKYEEFMSEEVGSWYTASSRCLVAAEGGIIVCWLRGGDLLADDAFFCSERYGVLELYKDRVRLSELLRRRIVLNGMAFECIDE